MHLARLGKLIRGASSAIQRDRLIANPQTRHDAPDIRRNHRIRQCWANLGHALKVSAYGVFRDKLTRTRDRLDPRASNALYVYIGRSTGFTRCFVKRPHPSRDARNIHAAINAL